ncbi:hypothetical protein [Lysinibacillus piscis]|uniref:Yip1 domain-containing protein n=1 Tax=Lysinibacillus piscis TaxID=2518931 RepID=A0ABQ5NHL0_9BACI|nr:hypothetical protein [Lysinibacillus sp. KH24]GLC87865.1 hypothetical protein LYSBPC_09920 [Lysinibacillus sp. KH24]
MLYDYKFWHSLTHPAMLAKAVEDGEIRGYHKRVLVVFFLFMALIIAREYWGIGTEGLTTLFATNQQNAYYVARLLSMVGALFVGILYFSFHYYGVTYILYVLTDIPYKWIQKVQLYAIVFVLIEKAILFVVFYAVGYTTTFSFLSFAPIVQQAISTEVVLFTINQLTVATVLTVIVQYVFLAKWEEVAEHKLLLVKITLLQLLIAIFIGMISVLPLQQWLVRGFS